MSASYLELDNANTSIGPRAAKVRLRATNSAAGIMRELRAVAASAAFKPAAIRVTSALALSFVLVKLAQHFLV